MECSSFIQWLEGKWWLWSFWGLECCGSASDTMPFFLFLSCLPLLPTLCLSDMALGHEDEEGRCVESVSPFPHFYLLDLPLASFWVLRQNLSMSLQAGVRGVYHHMPLLFFPS